jgi:hypothetical protein
VLEGWKVGRLEGFVLRLSPKDWMAGRLEGWDFAFYTYSDKRYELSVFPSGEFFGPPEEAFRVAGEVYL